MRIAAAGFGVTGAGREKNDDYYCLGPFVEQGVLTSLEIDTTSSSFRRYGFLVAVADGMGGYAGGNVASRILLEYLSARFYSEERVDFSDEELLSSLQRYLEDAQQALVTVLQRSPALQQAGTTLAGIVLAAPDRIIVFHIGDSRVLRFAAGYLRPLTIDHTVVGEDVASGRLTEEEALQIPDGGALLRSLGMHDSAEADWQLERALLPGNRFFLGTDGWFGLGRGLSRQQIQEIARQDDNPAAITQLMVRAAIAAGSQDDTTLVTVQIAEDDNADGR